MKLKDLEKIRKSSNTESDGAVDAFFNAFVQNAKQTDNLKGRGKMVAVIENKLVEIVLKLMEVGENDDAKDILNEIKVLKKVTDGEKLTDMQRTYINKQFDAAIDAASSKVKSKLLSGISSKALGSAAGVLSFGYGTFRNIIGKDEFLSKAFDFAEAGASKISGAIGSVIERRKEMAQKAKDYEAGLREELSGGGPVFDTSGSSSKRSSGGGGGSGDELATEDTSEGISEEIQKQTQILNVHTNLLESISGTQGSIAKDTKKSAQIQGKQLDAAKAAVYATEESAQESGGTSNKVESVKTDSFVSKLFKSGGKALLGKLLGGKDEESGGILGNITSLPKKVFSFFTSPTGILAGLGGVSLLKNMGVGRLLSGATGLLTKPIGFLARQVTSLGGVAIRAVSGLKPVLGGVLRQGATLARSVSGVGRTLLSGAATYGSKILIGAKNLGSTMLSRANILFQNPWVARLSAALYAIPAGLSVWDWYKKQDEYAKEYDSSPRAAGYANVLSPLTFGLTNLFTDKKSLAQWLDKKAEEFDTVRVILGTGRGRRRASPATSTTTTTGANGAPSGTSTTTTTKKSWWSRLFGGGEEKKSKSSSAMSGSGSSNLKGVGSITAASESGGNPGTISTGDGDFGGKSYGTYQLSSNMGTLQDFLNKTPYGQIMSGLEPGSAEFDSKWKELAKTDPNFGDAQHKYIVENLVGPSIERMKSSGVDLSGRGAAVQEAIFSTANQYGELPIIENALSGKDLSSMSDAEVIGAIQDYKENKIDSTHRSSSEGVRRGVLNRIRRERAELTDMAKAEVGTEQTGPAILGSLKDARLQNRRADEERQAMMMAMAGAGSGSNINSRTNVRNTTNTNMQVMSDIRSGDPTMTGEQSRTWTMFG